MRVSIIIPCYNHAHFLRDAVQSALSQTWPDCEVIVVDDGSTDESGAVARSYPRVRLVSQENRGLAAARNAGFAVSRGDLLIFLDADDRLWPDAARTAVDVLSAHPHAAMAYGRCRVVNGAGVPGATNPDVMQAVGYEQLLRDNCIWTPAMAAFRRRVLDTVGVFDETNSPAADYDLYLRTSRQFPIVCHERTVVDYRQHANNMSRDPVLMLHATLIVLRAQAAYAAGDECRRAAYRDAVASWRACYGERLVERFRTALRDRRFGAALRDAAHLLRLYPAGVRHHIAKKSGVAPGQVGEWCDRRGQTVATHHCARRRRLGSRPGEDRANSRRPRSKSGSLSPRALVLHDTGDANDVCARLFNRYRDLVRDISRSRAEAHTRDSHHHDTSGDP